MIIELLSLQKAQLTADDWGSSPNWITNGDSIVSLGFLAMRWSCVIYYFFTSMRRNPVCASACFEANKLYIETDDASCMKNLASCVDIVGRKEAIWALTVAQIYVNSTKL